jgi:serine/threonine-protein kinase
LLPEAGPFDKAIEAFGKEEELGHGFRPALLGYAYALAGRRADALKYIEEEKTTYSDESVHALAIVQTYVGLGDKNSALNWMERAYQQDPNWIRDFCVRPEVDSLRREPRFQRLLKKLGLPRS